MNRDCPRCLTVGSLKQDPYLGRICCTQQKCCYIDNLRFETKENETNNYEGDYEIKQSMRATQSDDNPFFQNQGIQFSGKNQEELNKQLTSESKMEAKIKQNYLDCLNKIALWSRVFRLPEKLVQLSKFNFNIIYQQTKNQKISKLGWKCVTVAAINWALKEQDLDKNFSIENILKLAGIDAKNYMKWNLEVKKQISGYREKFIEVANKFAKTLQMNDEEKKGVRELAEQIESKELFEGQKSETIAAAIIYIICQLSDRVILNLKTFKDISEFSEVSTSTIQKYYKAKLYPKRHEICPKFHNSRNPEVLIP